MIIFKKLIAIVFIGLFIGVGVVSGYNINEFKNNNDITPPITTIGYDYVFNKVYLNAYDPPPNASGIKETYYRFDSGPQNTYVTQFAIPDGAEVIWYWSVDNVGNAEIPKKYSIQWDSTPPITTHFYNSNTRIMTLNAYDPGLDASGVQYTMYKLDDFPNLYKSPFKIPEGKHKLIYFSVDNAGNEEQHHYLDISKEKSYNNEIIKLNKILLYINQYKFFGNNFNFYKDNALFYPMWFNHLMDKIIERFPILNKILNQII